MPDLVTLGPPVMVRPSEFSLLSPAVTLSTVMSFGQFEVNLVVGHGGNDVAVAAAVGNGFAQLDVVVAGNGHGSAEFFDIGAAAVALKVRPLLSTVVLASTPFWISALVLSAKSMRYSVTLFASSAEAVTVTLSEPAFAVVPLALTV